MNNKWAFPLAGMILYYLVSLTDTLGFITAFNMNFMGFVLFFLVIVIGYFLRKNSFLEKDPMIILGFIIIYVSIISVVINWDDLRTLDAIKNFFIFGLFIVLKTYNFSPVYDNKARFYLLGIIFSFLVLSLILVTPEIGVRYAGLSGFSGDFAKMVLASLFFVNEKKDSLKVIVFIHFMIFCFLIISSTVVAIVAYLLGMVYKSLVKLSALKALQTGLILLIGLIVMVYIGSNVIGNPAAKRVETSIYVTYLEVTGQIPEDMSIGRIQMEYGPGVGSGAWRIRHWKNTLEFFFQGDLSNIFFGFGFGSAPEIIEGQRQVHSEYLRVFFELGIIGFLLQALFYILAFKRIVPEKQFVFIIFAIFAISTNLLSNFVFTSFFILFFSHKKTEEETKEEYKEKAIA